MDEADQLLPPQPAAEASPEPPPVRVTLLFLFIALATVSPAAASMALVDEITTTACFTAPATHRVVTPWSGTLARKTPAHNTWL